MDKKNTFFGVVFLLGAFFLMFKEGTRVSEAQLAYEAAAQQEASEMASAEPLVAPVANQDATPALVRVSKANQQEIAPTVQAAPESIVTLENDYILVRFTSHGGGIKDVALKEYPAALDSEEPYIFNEHSQKAALALSVSDEQNGPADFSPVYELVLHEKNRVLFRLETEEGLQIYRGYSVLQKGEEGEPYLVKHTTRFVNKSTDDFDLKQIFVNAGTCPPTRSDTFGEYLNFGYYNGKDVEFVKGGVFHDSKGFLGMGAKKGVDRVEESAQGLVWAAVKNQFFASILTPAEPGVGFAVNPVVLPDDENPEEEVEGITGAMQFNLGGLAKGEEKRLDMSFYVGPKEYSRLQALGQEQDLIMQFGFFGMVSKLLLFLMHGIFKMIPNWGVTIILVTIIIKMVLWPLTAAQVRSSKRMAQIQGPMAELKEKYKDNPQKMQAETMRLFKEHRVNPAAGCLPLLVQLPIFLGFYFMLRTSSELRFASFLWIPDLSVPDTIAVISGFPVNILPLIMGVTMFLQMQMTPTPTTDNAQRKIFQMMPFIFLVFCYNFPSGLVLYWTVQNVLTIVQQSLTNRAKDPEPVVAVPQKKSKSKAKAKVK